MSLAVASGHVNALALISSDGYLENTLLPAREEMTSYLSSRCKADGHGDTLIDCIEKVGANDDEGYRNAFTNVVSTAPVVDRASALDAYEARMTYGFGQVSAAGKEPVVPEGAEELLATAFPELTDAQRRAILAATEIDSGYPLDSTSDGWQRVNLPKALSSKVTLDSAGAVVSVEPGYSVASVVKPDGVGLPSTGDDGQGIPQSQYVLSGLVVVLILGGLVVVSARRETASHTK